MLHTAPHSASYIAGTKVCSQFISATAILFRCVSIASLMLMSSLAVYAQTNTGSIRGFVYDESQAVIQAVTVTALDESRGVIQEAVATDSGGFVFSHLAPGMYTLSFEAPNFTPLTVEGFEVRVGGISTFSPQLAVAATETRVVVSAGSPRPVIEPERVQQSDHIDSVRIQNLPINRRDYLSLALLTPGVVNTNHIANAIDRRILPTPSSGLGIGGGNGRGNTFMIDGLDNLYNSGSVRSSISQDAIQEFQVNRNSFSAEQAERRAARSISSRRGGRRSSMEPFSGCCATAASRRAITLIPERRPIRGRSPAYPWAVRSNRTGHSFTSLTNAWTVTNLSSFRCWPIDHSSRR